ncbi:MAG: hypothetical protein QOH67_262, partial [Hyphomicrobiales bacterium]|nr:hypothetical protein [Hyphomicrobiales bacterium]
YVRYKETQISDAISPHDDMFVPNVEGNFAHYMSVGRSAIDIIVSALVVAGDPQVNNILDLPCGGGRVTRHLRAFFPNATLYVSDLAKEKEKFVLQSFGANQAEENPDFLIPPPRTYDLIFVGSLVTHFDEPRFRQAITWFVDSLSPKGLLVLTTHGRRHNYMQNKVTNYIAPVLWRNAQKGYDQTGFGYVEYPDIPNYGLSASSPSWIAKVMEGFTATRLLAFHEAAWDHHQDVVVLQRSDGWLG